METLQASLHSSDKIPYMHQKVFSNLLSFDEWKLIRHKCIGFSNHSETYMDSQVFLGMGAHAQALGSDTTNLLG